MVMARTIQTLIKVGRYDDSLESAIINFEEPLTSVCVGSDITIKYATFKEGREPYLLMVSQARDRSLTPPGYNVMLTVTSYLDSVNREVYEQFQTETGIDLSVDVPEWLKASSTMMELSFPVFEKNPKLAMSVLRGEI
tara:strand:+ start:210 stop:623 length:414 start_codon:yes stop_codon:yes gene_type:complete